MKNFTSEKILNGYDGEITMKPSDAVPAECERTNNENGGLEIAYDRGERQETVDGLFLTGERALFKSRNLKITNCTFADGESPLKESSDLEIKDALFRWKYPLWYCRNIKVSDSVLFDTARAGVWYTENAEFKDCVIEAPKTFRRAGKLSLTNVSMPDARETLWNCADVKLVNVTANGAYFAMNCKDVYAHKLTLTGDYCFDGAENADIRNSRILSKDSFWNSKNVTVTDSFISGEYLGWNSENLTFVNCTIESLQGLCYIKNLKMINCRLMNTTLAFEYSSVDAEITGKIDSVLNPSSGRICADFIEKLTVEPDKVDPSRTVIICRGAKDV